MITGSACTKRKLSQTQKLRGTTVARRLIETGRQVNLTRGQYASVTQGTDSLIDSAAKDTTTLARKVPVAFTFISCLLTN